MAEHNKLGAWGERKAAELLEEKGYEILECDWHFGHRDLDIVAMKDGVLVIVEVKTRRNNDFLEPEQAVDRRKIKSLLLAANAFVKLRGIDAEIRFDIISVIGTDDSCCEIRHMEDAFTL